ncbi:MAG TPA: chorismate mutase [Mycobacteriales bacterium]|nr:chorismate mutase [Mycobacteriales bacterium]
MASDTSSLPTTQPPLDPTVVDIQRLRQRIDELDSALIQLWRERSSVSKEIGARRMASGGTRIVLSREQQIIQKFHTELGPIGAQLAMLLLRAGRGAL